MINSARKFVIANGGGTNTIDLTQPFDTVILAGSPTLSSNYTLNTSGTPTVPTTIVIHYKATAVLGTNTITIMGETLTAEEALAGDTIFFCIYDTNSSVWRVTKLSYPDADNEGVVNTALTLAAQTITLTSNSKQYQRITGSGTLTGDVSVASSGTFPDGHIFYIKFDATVTKGVATVTLLGESLDANQALYGDCLVIAVYDLANTTFRTQLVQNPQEVHKGQIENITLPVSFETGEQCDNLIKIGYACTIEEVYASVTKVIAGTDDATISCEIAGTPTTPTTITIPMSSALNYDDSITVTADNTVAAGDLVHLVTAKTTAGGKALVTLKLKRI